MLSSKDRRRLTIVAIIGGILIAVIAFMAGVDTERASVESTQQALPTINTQAAPPTNESPILVEPSVVPKASLSYVKDFAHTEFTIPSWVVENHGAYTCDGVSTILVDRTTVQVAGSGAAISLTVDTSNKIAHVDFNDNKSAAIGVIVGGSEFAPVPADVVNADSATLEVSSKYFTGFADGVVVCSSTS